MQGEPASFVPIPLSLSPLAGDLSACFLWDRPSTPLPFSPVLLDDSPSRKRCNVDEDECFSQTYEFLSTNLKSGTLRIPRFTKGHQVAGRVHKLHDSKSENRGLKIHSLAKQVKTLEDGNVKRLRQMAKLNMACTSLFNEMKTAASM